MLKLKQKFVILLCVVHLSWERPQGDAAATIVKFDNETPSRTSNDEVEYSYNYETSNQIKAEETGRFSDDGYIVVSGSYSYIGPDGVTYEVFYVADEGGFRPTGAHIKDSLQRNVAQQAPAALLASLQGGGLG